MNTASIKHFGFLDATGSNEVVRVAESRLDLAIERRPESPGAFVTYGRCAYLDVCQPGSNPDRDYYHHLPSCNTSLWSAFSDLYLSLQEALAIVLDARVVYRPDALALPGLHIFRGNAIALADAASAHFDQQYDQLRLPTPPDAGVPPLSVTVPLRIPVHGTGLIVHDVTLGQFKSALARGTATSLEAYARRRTKAYHSYSIGTMVVHRGLLMHQLSSPGPIEFGDERITLQGHGIRCNGEWVLYW